MIKSFRDKIAQILMKLWITEGMKIAEASRLWMSGRSESTRTEMPDLFSMVTHLPLIREFPSLEKRGEGRFYD